MHKTISIDIDAFSSGQITSKIWLCEKLEHIFGPYEETIWVLGGWYGIASFLLLSRGIINIKSIRSFDIDPTCETIADTLLNNWVWQEWKFKAFTHDCNTLDYSNNKFGHLPSLVINTSCEHFDSLDWFENIPAGTKVALQSNNMPHEDHQANISSLDSMLNTYKLSKVHYSSEKLFKYPTWSFTRFMIIGIK